MTELMTPGRLEQTWIAPFDDFAAGRQEPAWLSGRRRQALTRFERAGFPTRKDEAWKYTRISPITKASFSRSDETAAVTVSPEAMARFTYWESSSARLVFVNGRYDEALSSLRGLPEGVRIESLSAALKRDPAALEERLEVGIGEADDALTALNLAYFTEGAFIHVPRRTRLEGPVHVLYLSCAGAAPHVAHVRNLIVADEGAEISLVERYASLDEQTVYFTNAVTEVQLAPDASVEHYKVQRESKSAFHLSTMRVRQERASRFRSTLIAVGGEISRTDVRVDQEGDGVDSTLYGLYVADGDRCVDNQVRVHHQNDHGTSQQLYKGILSDRAIGVFNGAIIVDENTKGTDAHQTNKNLLLSADATINTKPQLEIDADDVKCSHGATIGQLDQAALFYLRSRGISEDHARALLTYAFASDVIESIRIEPIQARVHQYLSTRTDWGGVAEAKA